jgi:PelA/Pel-15E family pectate lyase
MPSPLPVSRPNSPAKARSYELPAISGSESVGIVRYLMALDNPDARIIQAVKGAADWLKNSKLVGIAAERKDDPALPKGYDRVVVKDPNAPPLWARFYDIETNRPMFVGRDGIVKNSLAEIEYERRNGYSYLGTYATKLLAEEYPTWKKQWHIE